MKKSVGFLLCLAFLSLVACSTQWTEGPEGPLSSDELLAELSSMDSSKGSGVDLFSALVDKTSTNIYFMKASEDSVPVQSLFSFIDFSIFDSSTPDLSPFDIESGKVAFLDGFDDNGQRRFVLAIEYQLKDSGRTVSLKVADVGYVFGETFFQAIFPSENGDIVLETSQLEDGVEDFSRFIQLKVYRLFDDGTEKYIGKFSMLAGYGT